MAYTTPTIEKLADYSDATRGVWFGIHRDAYGRKALIFIIRKY